MPARKNPSVDFFWIAEAKGFCMLLTRHPWLDIPWQETNPFPEPVEGNISQKKTFVKRRGSALPASPIPVIPSSVFPYAMQQGVSFGCSGKQVQIFNNCYSKIC
ncbi:MAG: hypothetical protein J6Y30_09345 [Treponema sp.]|nr:hypothetical protein [Treponema sp.]